MIATWFASIWSKIIVVGAMIGTAIGALVYYGKTKKEEGKNEAAAEANRQHLENIGRADTAARGADSDPDRWLRRNDPTNRP